MGTSPMTKVDLLTWSSYSTTVEQSDPNKHQACKYHWSAQYSGTIATWPRGQIPTAKTNLLLGLVFKGLAGATILVLTTSQVP